MVRSYKNIYKYLSWETLSSFLVAFAFFFFIFFVNQILLIAEDILAKKVPILDVVVLLVYFLPYIVSMSFPFSALVGALMAIGRLSSDNEILAFRSAGISLLRIFAPLVVIGILFIGISFVFNDYLLPLSIIKSNLFYRQIIRSNPGLEFEPYTAKRYEDKSIITGDVIQGRMFDLVIIDTTAMNEKRVISAREAELLQNTAQAGVISLELRDVFSHVTDSQVKGDYEYTYADKMIYNFLIKDVIGSTVQTDPGPRGMSSVDLWKEIQEKQAKLQEKLDAQQEKVAKLAYELKQEVTYATELTLQTPGSVAQRLENLRSTYASMQQEVEKKVQDRVLRSYLLEFHRKFSHPFSCLVFIFFAFPVGLYARKSGKLVGFAIGVIIAGIYWGLLFVAIRLAMQLSAFPPALMMWMPNIIVFIFGSTVFALRLNK